MGKSYFFFGAIDRRGNRHDGDVVSEYPAYMNEKAVEDLEQTISMLEGQVSRGEVESQGIAHHRSMIERNRDKYNKIMESKPNLSDEDKNQLYKLHTELGNEMKESMFTRSDMEMGFASAQVEADRMVKPCIKLPKELIDTARDMKMNISNDGKISRDQATRLWRTIGYNINSEDPRMVNPETLRRDKVTVRTR